MRADSVARLTVAESTPGTFFSAFSTRDTHDAQVMPPMPMSTVAVPPELEIALIDLHMVVETRKNKLAPDQDHSKESHHEPAAKSDFYCHRHDLRPL